MKTERSAKKAGRKKKGPKKKRPTPFNQYMFFTDQITRGKSRNWLYDQGEWKEQKIAPEKWEINYSAIRRRKGKAPERIAAPAGTQSHWFILAHQYVTKLNADEYTTELKGLKLKVAHKRASTDRWNITEKGQRKKLIGMLKDFIRELESEPVEMEDVPGKKISRKKTIRSRGKKAA